MKIAAKALEDTNLRAPFSGVIANTFVENFQNVNAKDPILSLQDVTSVEIELYIPEQRMALSAKIKGSKVDLVATFDFLPGRKFAVEVSEFATETDPKTQTYLVTVVMLAPEDVTILPGMTATILAYPKQTEAMAEAGFAVPVDATGVDGVGQYFVWRVDEAPDGTGTVHRVNVQVGQMMQDQILIVGGLEKGDRIAASGIHVLQESQQIRLLGNGPGERTQ